VQLVVLAAGLGRRFGGLKQLLPLGPSGEAILDYTVHDALAAGFDEIVLVVRPEIETEVLRHTSRWPVRPRLAFQRCVGSPTPVQDGRNPRQRHDPGQAGDGAPHLARGTAPAVLAARALVGGPFAVANADDLYGAAALEAVRDHLERTARACPVEHAVVTFPAATSFLGQGPVRRAACDVDRSGLLVAMRELELVRLDNGDIAVDPARSGSGGRLDPGTPVSMNLWGFHPSIWPDLDRARKRFSPSHEAGAELLLPDVVDAMVSAGGGDAVRVLRRQGRCVGLTHPGDRADVGAVISSLVSSGQYPGNLWELP
jgi:MobA-like NTP transferase domain